jgi:hypothetical protein
MAQEATTPQGPAGPCVSFLSGLLAAACRPSFSFLVTTSHRPQLRCAAACAARTRHQPAAGHLLPGSMCLRVHVHLTGGQLTVTAVACACSLSLLPPTDQRLPWASLLGVLACSLSLNSVLVLLFEGCQLKAQKCT